MYSPTCALGGREWAFLAFVSSPAQPSDEFQRWLWLLTPVGAPVIEVLESPTHAPPHPGCVPRLARHDAEMPPGIPRLPGRQAPQEGRPRWEVESAFRYDIQGWTQVQIADSLDFRDHHLKVKGATVTQPKDDRSRSARRYVEAGRRTLAELGAWPWCLTREGALRRNTTWWTTEHYLIPLAVWHRNAFRDAIMDVLGTIEITTGTHDGARASEDRGRAADALYDEWYRRGLRTAKHVALASDHLAARDTL